MHEIKEDLIEHKNSVFCCGVKVIGEACPCCGKKGLFQAHLEETGQIADFHPVDADEPKKEVAPKATKAPKAAPEAPKE